MEAIKKRALLARVEGQLAAMDRGPDATDKRWQRVRWAIGALGQLPLSDAEAVCLARLQQHLARVEREVAAGVSADIVRHRRTLVRADCVLWQLQLRRRQVEVEAA